MQSLRLAVEVFPEWAAIQGLDASRDATKDCGCCEAACSYTLLEGKMLISCFSVIIFAFACCEYGSIASCVDLHKIKPQPTLEPCAGALSLLGLGFVINFVIRGFMMSGLSG